MQPRLNDTRSPYCPFVDRLEDDDHHCFSLGMDRHGYDVIAEDSPSFTPWMQETRGVGLVDVVATPTDLPELPAYIPVVKRGSGELFTHYKPEFVGVSLGDVVSKTKLLVATSLRERFGLPPYTKVILLAYGKDVLIENLWPNMTEVFGKLATLGFTAVTAVNYSIWAEQPHAERFINIKRNLLTYEELQRQDIPAIPHIYWSGRKDLDAWIDWLALNRCVGTVAINLQTLKLKEQWQRAMFDLQYFSSNVGRQLHYLITGPQELSRVRQVLAILPSVTLTNGSASRKAAAGQRLGLGGNSAYSNAHRSRLFGHNVSVYEAQFFDDRSPNEYDLAANLRMQASIS